VNNKRPQDRPIPSWLALLLMFFAVLVIGGALSLLP
jgi:hypothetical protein